MEVKPLSRGVCGIDRRPVQIDFHAVSRAINVTPSAARRRFARLKKQIEKNNPDTARKTPASEPASSGTEKPTRDQTASEATGSRHLQRPEYRTPQGAAQENTQAQSLSCRVKGHSNNGGHPVHIDLTQDHDGDGSGLNADESSDDDAPLMKKRRIAGTSFVLGRTSNHERASVRSDDKSSKVSNQTGEEKSTQSLSPAQRKETVNRRERSNQEKRMSDNKAGIVGGVSVTATQRTSEPQMVDLTGDEPPKGTSNANNTAGASSVQASPGGGNGADVHPGSLSEQDIYLFGDELFDSFLGDLQNADIPESYCYEATGWPQQASPSTLELEPLASRRASFMSIDEKPAYSWALRRLDQPNLAVVDHHSYG